MCHIFLILNKSVSCPRTRGTGPGSRSLISSQRRWEKKRARATSERACARVHFHAHTRTRTRARAHGSEDALVRVSVLHGSRFQQKTWNAIVWIAHACVCLSRLGLMTLNARSEAGAERFRSRRFLYGSKRSARPTRKSSKKVTTFTDDFEQPSVMSGVCMTVFIALNSLSAVK